MKYILIFFFLLSACGLHAQTNHADTVKLTSLQDSVKKYTDIGDYYYGLGVGFRELMVYYYNGAIDFSVQARGQAEYMDTKSHLLYYKALKDELEHKYHIKLQ